MQHFIKKAAALVMTLAMVLSLASVAFAADFPDMPDADHWSTTALEAAVENGLLSGKDGMIAGSAELTRAELATIITRAFAAEVEDDISFTDINSDTWYKTYAAKAVHMGAMTGKGDAFAGAAPVTRQEVMLVLARVLKLADGDAADLAAFSDADKTAAWAVGGVAAMVKAGYVSGSNGALNPTGNITRAEFAQMMYNIFNNAYITEAGTVEEVNGKNVIISSTNVTVKGVDIEGDVVIADGVGDGDVFFEDVTIGGRLVVRGGGVNSIHFKSSKVTTAILAKVDGNVRLVIEEESTVEVVSVEDGKASTDVCVVGIVGSVVVNNATSTVVLDNATVESVEVNAANATVSLSGKTTVTLMTVAESAGETQLQAQPESVITKLETSVDVFINDESVIKDCNDEEKINPERPEESGEPVESTDPEDSEFVESTGHSHTFSTTTVDGAEKETAVDFDATYHTFTCTSCGASVKRNHEYGAGETCTAYGCGHVKFNGPTIPNASTGTEDTTGAAEGCESTHVYDGEAEVTLAATCGKAGTAVYHCTKTEGCGATKTVTIAATGQHSYGTGNYANDAAKPTCVAAGTLTHYCKVCTVYNEDGTVNTGACGTGYSKTTSTAKTAHTLSKTWVNTDATNHWKKCTNTAHTAEGGKMADTVAPHTLTYTQSTLENGTHQHTAKCSVCGWTGAAENCTLDATTHKCVCGYGVAHKDTYTKVTPVGDGAPTHKITACTWSNAEHINAVENCTIVNGACTKCDYVDETMHAEAAQKQFGKTAQGLLAHRTICKCTAGASCTVVKPGVWTACTFTDGTCECGQKHSNHTWSTAGTGACTLCTATHSCDLSAVTTYAKNADQHWKVCPVCNKPGDKALHEAKETPDGTCKICGQTFTTHVHSYDKTVASPTGNCSVCGTACTHDASGAVKTGQDTNQHWKYCDTCGKITVAKENHAAGAYSTTPANGKHTAECTGKSSTGCTKVYEETCGEANCTVTGCTVKAEAGKSGS